jgi:hypothetical protein
LSKAILGKESAQPEQAFAETINSVAQTQLRRRHTMKAMNLAMRKASN